MALSSKQKSDIIRYIENRGRFIWNFTNDANEVEEVIREWAKVNKKSFRQRSIISQLFWVNDVEE